MRWWMVVWAAVLAVSPVRAATFVVAVGVEAYDDEGISTLKYAVADATALAGTFRARGVPEANITVLTTQETDRLKRPARTTILRALQSVRERAVGDDTLIFFFAGHGLAIDGTPCLLTSDSLKEDQRETALAIPLIESVLRGFQGKQVLFLIDACRNDPSTSGAEAALDEGLARGLLPKVESDLPQRSVTTALLLACGVGEQAWEMPEAGHGAFTHYLLAGLNGPGQAADGSVTLQSLAGYVRQAVPAWAAQRRLEQHPRLDHPDDSDFVLFEPGAGPAEPMVVVQATTAVIEVWSTPAGATVYLDGQPTGEQAPCKLVVKLGFAPQKTVEVGLRLAGHEDQLARVTVSRGQTAQVNLTLPAAGTLATPGTPPRRDRVASTVQPNPADVAAKAEEHTIQGFRLSGDGEHIGALAEYDQAMALDSSNAEVHLGLGDTLRLLEDYGGAEAAYRRATVIAPKGASAHFELARIYESQNRSVEALAEYRAAVQWQPTGWRYCLTLSNLLANQGDMAGAEAVWRKATVIAPKDSYLHYTRGAFYENQNRLAEAIAAYRAAAQWDPMDSRYHSVLSERLVDQGDVAGAEAVWRGAIKRDPQNSDLRYELGSFYEKQNRPAEALAEYRAAVQLAPGYWVHLMVLSNLLVKQGNVAGAAAVWREAIAHDPQISELHYWWGNFCEHQNRPAEALAEYRTALQLWPSDIMARLALSKLLVKQGDVAGAEAVWPELIALDPTKGAPHYELGSFYENQNRLSEALAEYRTALQLDPKHWPARLALSNLLAKQGDMAGAEGVWGEALARAPKESILHYELGSFFEYQNRHDDAITAYRRAAELGSEKAEAALKRLEAE